MAVAGVRYTNEFDVLGKLGEGAFGVVYLIQHKITKDKLARKEIALKNLTEDEKEATEKEVEVMKKTDHPNILSLKCYNITEDYLYIYTEYCSGGDLQDLLKDFKRPTLPEKLIVCWLSQMADALKYLHGKRILHRDLKPPNIYLTDKADIKLGDLGIARVMKPTESLVMSFVGTPVYMSPESLSRCGYNEKTDIWSLGCIIYELATTNRAFSGFTLPGLILNVMTNKPPNIPDTYTKELIRVTLHMLLKDPEDRPNAQDIIDSEPVRSYLRNPYAPLPLLESMNSSSVVQGSLRSSKQPVKVSEEMYRKDIGVPKDVLSTQNMDNNQITELNNACNTIIGNPSTLSTIMEKKEPKRKKTSKTLKKMPTFDKQPTMDENVTMSDILLSMMSSLSTQDSTLGASSGLYTEDRNNFLLKQIQYLQSMCARGIGQKTLTKAYGLMESASDPTVLEEKLRELLGHKYEEYHTFILYLRLFELLLKKE
ncbi:probable serine/threonine-protein kinase nek2 [Patella vulgata]|uniref:probable serine/threonine-protein kinase nek2 n=1 Tax=Patella vulgata TaxID=6465 RepID=UPI0024A7FC88|nr:probable serine/threonine-protein kinase nek2 [Patella vulgata]